MSIGVTGLQLPSDRSPVELSVQISHVSCCRLDCCALGSAVGGACAACVACVTCRITRLTAPS